MEALEVLSPQLLTQYEEKLPLIDHWVSVFNWSNGWHYDLDILWILAQIEARGLKKGATILDAGAGLGVAQFILASLGYNIISLDFTYRNIPKFSESIFKIQLDQDRFDEGTHSYMEFMNYGLKKNPIGNYFNFQKIYSALKNPAKVQYILNKKFRNYFNLSYFLERQKDHKDFGNITFLRGSFNKIPLPENSVDMLISISAFEHNTYDDMPASVKEFERVIKKDGLMLVTTSLAKEKDWFFEPSKGWNFTSETLQKWFDVKESKPIDFNSALNEIRQSKYLEKRISPFYRFNGDNGLPFAKLSEAQYVPCGIAKHIS